MLPVLTIHSDDNKETLTGAVATVSLLSPPTNNSARVNPSQRSARMKCFFHCKQNHFFDYFDNPILDDAVIFASDILSSTTKERAGILNS